MSIFHSGVRVTVETPVVSDCLVRFPDFFIVGAPKCGTTSVAHYLAQRKDVFIPVKEPHYFAQDCEGGKDTLYPTLDAYLKLYEPAPRGALVGDASTHYIISRGAIPAILERRPDAKFIALLRNPINMAQSLLNQRVWNDGRADLSTREAWEIHERAVRVECALAEHLRRFLALVPPEQRLIVLLQDLSDAPAQTYQSILDFLGLERDGREEFPVMNRYKTTRSQSFERVHERIRIGVRRMFPGGNPLRSLGFQPLQWARQWNTVYMARPPLDRDVRSVLESAFGPEVTELGRLLDRDLSNAL